MFRPVAALIDLADTVYIHRVGEYVTAASCSTRRAQVPRRRPCQA